MRNYAKISRYENGTNVPHTSSLPHFLPCFGFDFLFTYSFFPSTLNISYDELLLLFLSFTCLYFYLPRGSTSTDRLFNNLCGFSAASVLRM